MSAEKNPVGGATAAQVATDRRDEIFERKLASLALADLQKVLPNFKAAEVSMTNSRLGSRRHFFIECRDWHWEGEAASAWHARANFYNWLREKIEAAIKPPPLDPLLGCLPLKLQRLVMRKGCEQRSAVLDGSGNIILSYEPDAFAVHLVRSANSHRALVAALEDLLQRYEGALAHIGAPAKYADEATAKARAALDLARKP